MPRGVIFTSLATGAHAVQQQLSMGVPNFASLINDTTTSDHVAYAIIGTSIGLGLLWAIAELLLLSRIELKGPKTTSKGADVTKELDMMRQVSSSIAEGATAFLMEEYKWLAGYMVLFVGIMFAAQLDYFAILCFFIGAVISGICGFMGMRTAVMCNVRTCHECWTDLSRGYDVAIRGGSVMGMLLPAMGIFSLGFLHYLLATVGGFTTHSSLFEALAGYGLGGSSIALFARVGGGIYTKAADVGADLSGKNEYGMDEDDPRNPACIADNVGDNVGDIAGMGADLFGSFAESTCASLILLSSATNLESYSPLSLPFLYPLLISSSGLIASGFALLLVTSVYKVTSIDRIEMSLKLLLIVSTVFALGAVWGVSYLAIGSLPANVGIEFDSGNVSWIQCAGATSAGTISGLLIGLCTEYYTSHSYRPVREISETQRVSAATGIIFGLALGYLSTIVPGVLLIATIVFAKGVAGNFGISLAALGMLSTMGVGLAIDAYGPISDNAGGIAEMSGLGPEVRARTDALDAAGNTTAAIGKGFAIGSAALVSLALFGAFCTAADISAVNLMDEWPFAGLLLGAMLPFAFSALTMKAVGEAAQDMVTECMRQFPDIISKKAQPDYKRCIEISTRASIYQMIVPGLMVIAAPLLSGALFGRQGAAATLLGALVTGVLMAISMSNTGGAWDNAKKYIEAGGLGSDSAKGSAAHKNAVIGDTVGDPLKDTSGPSLNILVKLSAITAVIFANLISTKLTTRYTCGRGDQEAPAYMQYFLGKGCSLI